jgi:hypothetical protein
MFRVVTIAPEFDGGVISRSIAERRGWKLLDKSVIENVASSLKCVPLPSYDLFWTGRRRGGTSDRRTLRERGLRL